MNSQKVAGAIGALIGLAAVVYALAYAPKGSEVVQAKQPNKVELPQPAAKSPAKRTVVTDVPQ